MWRWPDTLLKVRNRLVASDTFQRRAAALPGVRSIARQQARSLFDLCSGFVYSQVLLAAVRLRLFDHLKSGPRSLDDLAARMELPETSARRLLEAAVTLGLTTRAGPDRYALGMKGAALSGNPGLQRMIEHNALLYEDLLDPVAFLKQKNQKTALSAYWAYAESSDPKQLTDAEVENYSALMTASQPLVAHEILAAYPFQNHQTLLDAGGGEGAFLAAAGQKFPALNLMLFDLPAVARRAKETIETAGLSGRTRISGGSFLTDPLPKGADLIALVRIVHDHDDESVRKILKSAHDALPPGGTLLIAEPLAGTAGAERMGETYFGFYLMAMRSGRPRTAAELERLLRDAGFSTVRHIATHIPLQTSLIAAQS